MTFITGHHKAIRELTEALGIDPHKTRGFTITVDAGAPVIVEIRQLAEIGFVKTLVSEIKRYELKEV
jgi:hypothetical protein